MRSLKNALGVLLVLLCLGPIGLAAENQQPLFLFEIPLFLFLAFLCFRKTRKEKMKRQKSEYPECDVLASEVAPVDDAPSIAISDYSIITTEHELSAIPKDIAKDMRRYYTFFQAQRDAEIMAESFRLAGSTVTMDVFCMRYDLAMRKAFTLLQAEKVGVRGIKRLNCHNACIAVIRASHALKIRMLADYEQSAFSQAELLKTEKGKLNRYLKIKRELEQAKYVFTDMEEYMALLSKVNDRIVMHGGIIPNL